MATNASNLMSLGMASALAGEVVRQIGTTSQAEPTATVRGGVLQQASIADLSGAPTMTDVNAILAALRAAGVLETP